MKTQTRSDRALISSHAHSCEYALRCMADAQARGSADDVAFYADSARHFANEAFAVAVRS